MLLVICSSVLFLSTLSYILWDFDVFGFMGNVVYADRDHSGLGSCTGRSDEDKT